MARWSASVSAEPELRRHMAARAETHRDDWLSRCRDDRSRAYIARLFDALVARWRGDDPVEVDGWELPDDLCDVQAARRYVVLGDGAVVLAEHHDRLAGLRVVKSGAGNGIG